MVVQFSGKYSSQPWISFNIRINISFAEKEKLACMRIWLYYLNES